MQSALANADPSGLCPLERGLGKVEARSCRWSRRCVRRFPGASEAGRSGHRGGAAPRPDRRDRPGAGGQGGRGRRRHVKGGDHRMGAGRALDRLAFRPGDGDGHASARTWSDECQSPGARLAGEGADSQRRARLPSARIATGLGVFSSQALMDLYSSVYDATDPERSWPKRRLAGPAGDGRQGPRYAAGGHAPPMVLAQTTDASGKRSAGPAGPRRISGRARCRLAGRSSEPDCFHACRRVRREAARWTGAVTARWMTKMPTAAGRCWRLPLRARRDSTVSFGRINAFIGRDDSPGKQRSALLVAGLAGLGRIDGRAAGRLNSRHGLGLGRRKDWTQHDRWSFAAASGRDCRGSCRRRHAGERLTSVPAMHMFHAVTALAETARISRPE